LDLAVKKAGLVSKMCAHLGVNICLAQLNSLSHAAHDGNGVFSGNKVNK